MTTSIFSDSWIDIVFDGRNQHYGAYELRRIRERNNLLALLISTLFLSLALNFILMKKTPAELISAITETPDDGVRTMEDIPVLPPLPPDQPPAGEQARQNILRNTLQFNNLEIVDDATTVDSIPPQDAFENAEAGTETHLADSMLTASVALVESGTGINGQSNEPRVWVEQMPEFPGGEVALYQYIQRKTDYPEFAKENEMEGTAYVQFVVEKDGSLSNISIGKGTYKCLNEEALRVVKSMPDWKQGKQNGEPVRVRFVVPIRFDLEN